MRGTIGFWAIVFIVSLLGLKGKGQDTLAHDIDEFLSDETVAVGVGLPFQWEGREEEVKKIVRQRMETVEGGLAYEQLLEIADAMEDKELKVEVLRAAVESMLEEPLDPLSEGVFLEKFVPLSNEKDVELLQNLLKSSNLRLQGSRKIVREKLIEEGFKPYEALAEEAKGDEPTDLAKSRDTDQEAGMHPENNSRIPMYFFGTIAAILVILVVWVLAKRRRQ